MEPPWVASNKNGPVSRDRRNRIAKSQRPTAQCPGDEEGVRRGHQEWKYIPQVKRTCRTDENHEELEKHFMRERVRLPRTPA